ncbi:hypothetical protein K239x_34460 [Planctomycetes bacterium K23_9]|uniref:Uncharacterized protein n=1 Tax=Stieleria marina TaxID=1930275 RepID=A0A517NWF9_9BACT|nr:hypothetical protein K239x_34460 [Planctomycetes bacterium K23_9]
MNAIGNSARRSTRCRYNTTLSDSAAFASMNESGLAASCVDRQRETETSSASKIPIGPYESLAALVRMAT